MTYRYTSWDYEGVTIVDEDEFGNKLAVRDRDQYAAEIMEAEGSEVWANVVLEDEDAVRDVIEALEEILDE
jgi:hypothetical protein